MTAQTITTSHSPEVVALYPPTSVRVLENQKGVLSSRPISPVPLGADATNASRKLIRDNRVQLVEALMQEHVLKVLDLSVMHGSRLRLDQRLRRISSLKQRYGCSTFDSLAWRIVSRWKGLTRELSLPPSTDYESTCFSAAVLLQRDEVGWWLSRSWPVVVVDEVQDCNGSRLAMLRAIQKHVRLLTAGDEFQDLLCTEENGCLAWLREVSERKNLTTCHRTKQTGLIQASWEIKEGRNVIRKGKGFLVLEGQNENVCASHVSRSLTYHGYSDAAILTPTAKSSFFGQVLNLVSTRKYRDRHREVGPYCIHREKRPEEIATDLKTSLGLEKRDGTPVGISDLSWPAVPGAQEVKMWLQRQRRVFGRGSLSVDEVEREIEAISQRIRIGAMSWGYGARSMTVYQAKNREFKNVIVVWPYKVGGSPESMRRLLYNAITRAKEFATLIVQGQGGYRLGHPPFGEGEVSCSGAKSGEGI